MNEFIVIEELFLSVIGVFSVPFRGVSLILWFVGVAILMDFMKYLKIFITGSTIDGQSLRDFYSYMENLDRYSYDKDIYSTYVPDNVITINGMNKLDNVIGINGNDIPLIGIDEYRKYGFESYDEFKGELEKEANISRRDYEEYIEELKKQDNNVNGRDEYDMQGLGSYYEYKGDLERQVNVDRTNGNNI